MELIIIAGASVVIAGAIVVLVIRLHKTLDEVDLVLRNTNSVVADVRMAKDQLKYGALSGVLKIAKLVSGLGGERT